MADWIIVVDDNLTNLKLAGTILSKKGMRVSALKSGQGLLDFVGKNGVPDLILLDINMPGLDGIETLHRLRAQGGSSAEVPVAFLTADENEDCETRARQAGAVDFIRKPFQPELLVSRVKSILDARAAKPESAAEEGAAQSAQGGGQSAQEPPQAPGTLLNELGRDVLANKYQSVLRYLERYHGRAYRVLFTLKTDEKQAEARRELLSRFRQMLQHSLRSSDIMLEVSDDKLFLLLPEARDRDIDHIVSRLLEQWEKSEYAGKAVIRYEAGEVSLSTGEQPEQTEEKGYSVVVVDDNEINLKMAGHALSRENFRVTTLLSGQALLDHLDRESPDLILLDYLMPEMDGFETMRRLRERVGEEIPVIFLTADENRETEIRALQLGAMDLIRKPIVAEVMNLRVRHTIELVRLQRNLAAEVSRKTKENENLVLSVVQTLADAIDAKDTYTKGHSGRVAAYAREIAHRFGYSYQQEKDIYMMGLLHDVGKIGVPDAIINKPARLTDEEYSVIKTHTTMGARILSNITAMPILVTGARWHHERYDGGGYPDGLAGADIPEQARIIAVADAYDAMTSRRSYRDILPQDTVREELQRGRGRQFDPVFADIMLTMMDEDRDYKMREN